nr:PREDICTED: jmjC domain-containing protein 4 [Bemisia tabaci]
MEVLNIDKSDFNFALSEFDPLIVEDEIGFKTISNQPVECYSNFFVEHLVKNQPCIIKACAQDWTSSQHWTISGKPNFTLLKDKFGSAQVSVSDCKVKYYNAHQTKSMIFSDFMNYWEKYSSDCWPANEACLYLKDWHLMKNFPTESVYVVPYQFSSDWLNEYYMDHPHLDDDYRFVYMGPKGTWTPLHADVFTSFSWSANICGKKKWLLFPPGEEHVLKDECGNLAFDVTLGDVSASDISPNRSFTVVQEPGEVIFVPSGWHHQVWNEDDTISINHNWINACNIHQVWTSLKANLEAVKKEVSDCQDMDDWFEHCQLMLKSTFGMNYEEFYRFLFYVGTKRIEHLNQNELLSSFQTWKFGREHMLYDLVKIKEVLLLFIDCDELVELPFYSELNNPPEFFINDINNTVNGFLSSEYDFDGNCL